MIQIIALLAMLLLAQPVPVQPAPTPAPPIAPILHPRGLTSFSQIWLPLVMDGTVEDTSCFHSAETAQFYDLLIHDSRQQRPALDCDKRLVRAAELRAASFSGDGLAHCDALGLCANTYARAADCRLPTSYSMNGNDIESLFAGAASPRVAFEALARSRSHSTHLFGYDERFKKQNQIGITMVQRTDLKYQYYWVIMIAECW